MSEITPRGFGASLSAVELVSRHREYEYYACDEHREHEDAYDADMSRVIGHDSNGHAITAEDVTDALRTVPRRAVGTRREASASPTTAEPNAKKPRRGIPAAEVNVLVRNYLEKHAKPDPDAMSVRRIAGAIGASTGAVANCPAWRAFEDARKARRNSQRRTVQLTAEVLAITPDAAAGRNVLAALVEVEEQDELLAKLRDAQERDMRSDLRRRNRVRERCS